MKLFDDNIDKKVDAFSKKFNSDYIKLGANVKTISTMLSIGMNDPVKGISYIEKVQQLFEEVYNIAKADAEEAECLLNLNRKIENKMSPERLVWLNNALSNMKKFIELMETSLATLITRMEKSSDGLLKSELLPFRMIGTKFANFKKTLEEMTKI